MMADSSSTNQALEAIEEYRCGPGFLGMGVVVEVAVQEKMFFIIKLFVP
jgi:hypothetical protein